MRALSSLLTRWRERRLNETVLEESSGASASDIVDAYRDLLAQELAMLRIPPAGVVIDIRNVGNAPGGANFVAVLHLLAWERDATLPLLLSLPFLERRLRQVLRSHWLADITRFRGIWLHASEQMLASPDISHLRQLLASFSGGQLPESVPATLPGDQGAGP